MASKNGFESMNRRLWIKILSEFYATVRTKDAEDHECDSLRVMLLPLTDT